MWKLTARGQRLYFIHRNFTGFELTVDEFVDGILSGTEGSEGVCLSCEKVKRLISGVFCVTCIRGSVLKK